MDANGWHEFKKEVAGCAVWVGLVLVAPVATMTAHVIEYELLPSSPKNTQAGFIPKSKLEIVVENHDQNDPKNETYLMVDGKPYAIMYNKDHQPILAHYEMVPQVKPVQ